MSKEAMDIKNQEMSRETDDMARETKDNIDKYKTLPPKSGDTKSWLEDLDDYKNSGWVEIIAAGIEPLLESLADIYAPGYNGISEPVGLMTPVGLYTMNASGIMTAVNIADGSTSREMLNAFYNSSGLVKPSGDKDDIALFLKGAANGDPLPIKYKDLKAGGDISNFCFYWLHIRLMFGYAKYCKGMSGVTGDKATSYSIVAAWAEEYLMKVLLSALKAEKIPYKGEELDDELQVKGEKILKDMIGAFHNTAVLSEIIKDKGKAVDITAVYGHTSEPKNNFLSGMEKQLGAHGNENQSLTQIDNKYRRFVTRIRFVKNVNQAESTTLFAGNVLKGVLASGIRPSWNNVFFGKKLDGTPMFHKDFKGEQPLDRVIFLYGGSGSGKGNMTNALLCSALVDECALFYMDGKPETAVNLGRLSWEEGGEAAVFNGFHVGQAANFGARTLEMLSCDKRDPAITLKALESIPPSYFSESDAEKFLAVTRYTRGLEIFLKIVMNSDKKSRWKVFVFDEVENFTKSECSFINDITANLKTDGLTDADITNLKKLNPVACTDKMTPRAKYIVEWFNWRASLVAPTVAAMTISLRTSNANVIFIFQSSNWVADSGNAAGLFTKVVKLAASTSTKIVGGNSIQNGYGNFGAANAKKSKWYNDMVNKQVKNSKGISVPTGKWAVIKAGSVDGVSESDVKDTIFKGVTLWGGDQGIAIDERDESGARKKTTSNKFLPKYLEDLFEGLNIKTTPGAILDSGFTFLDSTLKGITDKGLIETVYSVPGANTTSEGFDLKKMLESMSEEERKAYLEGMKEEGVDVTPKETPKETSKETPKETPEETSEETSEDTSEETPEDNSGETSEEASEADDKDDYGDEEVDQQGGHQLEDTQGEFEEEIEEIEQPQPKPQPKPQPQQSQPQPRNQSPTQTQPQPQPQPQSQPQPQRQAQQSPVPVNEYKHEPVIELNDGSSDAQALDQGYRGHEERGMTKVENIPNSGSFVGKLTKFFEVFFNDSSPETALVALNQRSNRVLEFTKEKLEKAASMSLIGDDLIIANEKQPVKEILASEGGVNLMYTIDLADFMSHAFELKHLILDRPWADEFVDVYGLTHIAELFKVFPTLKAIAVGNEVIRVRNAEATIKAERAEAKRRKEIKRQYDQDFFRRTSEAWKLSTGGQKLACARMARWSANFVSKRETTVGKITAGIATYGATAAFGIVDIGRHLFRTGQNLRRQRDDE